MLPEAASDVTLQTKEGTSDFTGALCVFYGVYSLDVILGTGSACSGGVGEPCSTGSIDNNGQ